jgi:hypothetical protein
MTSPSTETNSQEQADWDSITFRGKEEWFSGPEMGGKFFSRFHCLRMGHVWEKVELDKRLRAIHDARRCDFCGRVEVFIAWRFVRVQVIVVECIWLMEHLEKDNAQSIFSELAKSDPSWIEGISK